MAQLPSSRTDSPTKSLPAVVEANARPVESEPERVAHEVLPREANRFLRNGLWVLLLFFGGFLIWAATAPLDAGVPAPGVTIVESKRKTVAHLTGGIVAAIYVKDMQEVEEGQPLLALDDTVVTAQYQSTLKEYYALAAVHDRLLAERQGAATLRFSPLLTEATELRDVAKELMAQQRALFVSRRQALEAELRLYQEAAETAERNAAARQAQLAFLKEQLAGMRSLAQEGYAPRNAQLELERQVLDLQNQIQLSQRQALEARLRAQARREELRKEVETQLAEVVKQLTIVQERLHALKEEKERTVIRAPASGYVNGLTVHTVGGVIRPGEPLMEIVPKDERLVFEVQVPAHQIERIRPGQNAEVQLSNYPELAGKVLEGVVTSVSADLVVDRSAAAGQPLPPHYIARVELTDRGWAVLGPQRQLQPGMPVTVLIKTGERTFLEYLLKPMLREFQQAIKEP